MNIAPPLQAASCFGDARGGRAIRSHTPRLAIIVSHPIQYYAPLYQRLASRDDVTIKVFFTWHGGDQAVHDAGFGQDVAWDIALTCGYDSEVVPNVASPPGTGRFNGLQNPDLVARVLAWSPDIVLINGWAWRSHLEAIYRLSQRRIPVLFRGDSHLLDGEGSGPRRWLKHALLSRVYARPAACLFTGAANRAYFEAFGVESGRLFHCPHSIDVARFAEPAKIAEDDAAKWRRDLGIGDDQTVVLFAGKFEAKKQPLALMDAVRALDDPNVLLVLVGAGELEPQVRAKAAAQPNRFRVLPFQNQSRMPAVYRLGDLFALVSSHNETWGLAVNEALASGRPVLVSDRVGCAADVVHASCGRIVASNDPARLEETLNGMTASLGTLRVMRVPAARRAWQFDVNRTESALTECVLKVLAR
jgi:glycosyltransferase involved in cell wall biosynthesis